MPGQSVLLDIGRASPCCADHGIEALHKAIAEEPSESAIWRPHENPLLSGHIERLTAIYQGMFQEAQDALLAALGLGDPVAILRKADALSADDTAAIRLRLAKPISEYTPDDCVALVDLVFGTRINPASVSVMAADLTTRSALAGHLQAIADSSPAAPSLAVLATIMDRVVHGHRGTLPPPQSVSRGLEYAKARVGLNLQGVTDAARGRIATTILRHIDEHGLAAPGKLRSTLLDNFGDLNRDWRRIAITEAGEVANTVHLAQFPEGTRIKRVEAYEGACPFCRRINGLTFAWVQEPREQDGWAYVWPGKTNVGRSASPKKRGPDGLEDRSESELWWPAAGVQHPNCRGRYMVIPSDARPPGVDPQFHAWLAKEIAKHG
jgi:hypothetical protein